MLAKSLLRDLSSALAPYCFYHSTVLECQVPKQLSLLANHAPRLSVHMARPHYYARELAMQARAGKRARAKVRGKGPPRIIARSPE